MGGAGRLLVELDALAAEIQQLEKRGELTGYPEWRDDVEQAEKLFLETPEQVPGWLERIRIKRLSKQMKSLKVIELAEKLVKDAIIAVPPQTWNVDLQSAQDTDKEPTDEELLVFRLGFIFLAYRIDYWYKPAHHGASFAFCRAFLVALVLLSGSVRLMCQAVLRCPQNCT